MTVQLSHFASRTVIQETLFKDTEAPLSQKETLPLCDGELLWIHGFLPADHCLRLFETLRTTLPWRQDHLTIAGRTIPVPRLQAWLGDAGTRYQYSGLTLEPEPWTRELALLKSAIESASQTRFNSVLANLYRDEKDSVSWHADNEPELGTNPVVASLSLGATRTFQLKHQRYRDRKHTLPLKDGDLLIMKGTLQHHWLHQVPKNRHPCQPRINLTFRAIDRNKSNE